MWYSAVAIKCRRGRTYIPSFLPRLSPLCNLYRPELTKSSSGMDIVPGSPRRPSSILSSVSKCGSKYISSRLGHEIAWSRRARAPMTCPSDVNLRYLSLERCAICSFARAGSEFRRYTRTSWNRSRLGMDTRNETRSLTLGSSLSSISHSVNFSALLHKRADGLGTFCETEIPVEGL